MKLKPIRHVDYFEDGRGHEVCRVKYPDGRVIWEHRDKGDEPGWWRFPLSDQREKRLEEAFNNLGGCDVAYVICDRCDSFVEQNNIVQFEDDLVCYDCFKQLMINDAREVLVQSWIDLGE
mgnify:CR=1 FL=1